MNYGKKKALSAASVGRFNLTGAPAMALDPPSDDDGDDSDKESVKRKSRNMSEKKRRDQFNILVNELCVMVSGSNRKMDKTSVLKSTISFLRIHNDMTEQSHAHEIREDWKPTFLSNDEFAQLMLEALDGFLLVITQGGTIMFASESVTSLLNHLPSDLVNQSIYNFTHADERMKIYQLLSQHRVVPGNGEPDYERDENQLQFTCHLKCGTTLPDEHSVYELVECAGNFRRWNSERVQDDDMDVSGRSAEEVCFCCTVRLKCPQLIREMSVVDDSKKEFTSRMSLEWSFLFLDHRGSPIIGYLPFEVLGTSGYDYYHPDDLNNIAESHQQLLQTGEGTSCYYRFLTKGQQWIWLQTRFYITYHQWNSKPEFVVCTNTVVSYAEVRTATRERHVAENLNLGNEPSNPDTTNTGVWMMGAPASPSPATSRRSVTASEISDVEVSEASKIMSPSHTAGQSLPVVVSRHMSVQSSTQEPGESSVVSVTAPAIPDCSASDRAQIALRQIFPQQNKGEVTLTPVQTHLKEQLVQKHRLLQEQILRQQEELRMISEQLNLSVPGPPPSPQLPSIGHPMILEHATLPVVCTSSNDVTLLTSSVPTSTVIPLTTMTTIPMVIQPQHLVLGMQGGSLITAPVSSPDSTAPVETQPRPSPREPDLQ